MASLANKHSYKKIAFLSLDEPVATALFLRGLYTPAVVANITGTYESDVRKQLNTLATTYNSSGTGTDYISWLETNFYMQNQLLKDADYMSMWHSLEIRVPFLDKAFMELAAHTSPELKMHPQTGKYLLIEAFKDLLPETIWNRRKQGFTFPFEKWLLASQVASPVNTKEQHFFKQFQQGRINWSRYWSICLLNRWNKQHAATAGW
jgi:asparagine synthase (glutamine-hydrolysing)